MDLILWIDLVHGRYFAIPEGEPLAEGSLQLLGLNGQVITVSAQAVARWQQSAAQVEAYLQKNLSALLSNWQSQLAETLGIEDGKSVSAEDVVFKHGFDLAYVAETVVNIVQAAGAQDKVQLALAYQQLQKLVSRIQVDDAGIQQLLDQLLDVIRGQPIVMGAPGVSPDALAALQLFAPPGMGGQSIAPQALGHSLGELQSMLKMLQGAQETSAERQQRYRDMARQAIDERRKHAAGFDFKQLWQEYHSE